jgi:hypothetical protein
VKGRGYVKQTCIDRRMGGYIGFADALYSVGIDPSHMVQCFGTFRNTTCTVPCVVLHSHYE